MARRRRFSVDRLSHASGKTRRQVLAALRSHGDDPVAALVALGEDRTTAGLLADAARLAGPDAGTSRRRASRSDRPVPRKIRRAADRGAGPRGREPSEQVQAAANAGTLTRANTRPGSAGRRAVDRSIYRRRTLARPEGITARTAAGHESEAARRATHMSAVVSGGRFVEFGDLSRSDRRRIARWNALASNLATGDISPGAFRSRVRSWAPIGGERFEWDPDVVLAVLSGRRESGDPTFVYRGRRR